MIRKTDVEIWKGLVNTNKELHRRVKFLESVLKGVSDGVLSTQTLKTILDRDQVHRHLSTDGAISRDMDADESL